MSNYFLNSLRAHIDSLRIHTAIHRKTYLDIHRFFLQLSCGLLAIACVGCVAQRPGPEKQVQTAQVTKASLENACRLCHSTREMQRGPIIDGLPRWYLELQLHKFRDGQRGKNPDNRSEALMGAGISILTNNHEVVMSATLFADRPAPRNLLTVKGDKDQGKLLYAQCVACHGERAEGRPELKSPPLNTLEDWYHLDQLRKFKSGLRGYDPRDTEGVVMRAAMAAVDPKVFRDIVRYVAEDLAIAPR